MDFFSAQQQARRNTWRLLFLLIIAVVATIAVTVLVVATLLFLFDLTAAPQATAGATSASVVQQIAQGLDGELVAWVAGIVLLVVITGSLFKRLQLSAGGRIVAEALGGRRIAVDTQDAEERKILNVVEEMAIASGMPVPPVYLLQDDSINAFAAGHQLSDAVIGITRGAVRQLSRAELQGVIAHEYSHILHGDMRLNMRLVAILHGILVIGLAGQSALHSMRFRRLGGGRRGNSAAAVLMLGLALMLIGYIGLFFGNLIKAAVSRQREFLADASAVQFTRYPESIGGALIRIGANQRGSRLDHAQAAEFSHLYFSQGVAVGFSRMLATHPPLEERIRRVMPGWDGRFKQADTGGEPKAMSGAAAAATTQGSATAMSTLASGLSAAARPHSVPTHAADQAIAHIGEPGERELAWAQQLLSELNPALKAAAHDPIAAQALVYGLLLAASEQRAQHHQTLLSGLSDAVATAWTKLDGALTGLDPHSRLPLVELSLPALKQLDQTDLNDFKHGMAAVIRSDGKVSLMEWALYQFITHHLDPQPVGAENKTLKQSREAVEIMLSVLARAGQDTPKEAAQAVSSASQSLPWGHSELRPLDSLGPRDLTAALAALRRLKPLEKPTLLKAMARCIEHSGEIRPVEAELFRALGEALDCPMPPLLQDQVSRTTSSTG